MSSEITPVIITLGASRLLDYESEDIPTFYQDH